MLCVSQNRPCWVVGPKSTASKNVVPEQKNEVEKNSKSWRSLHWHFWLAHLQLYTNDIKNTILLDL